MQHLKLQGKITYKLDPKFDAQIKATLFNLVDPGRKPEVIVEPANVDDVIAAIRYAQSAGLQVSVCSGGHSWSANHLRNNSLLIDMSNFNKFSVDHERMEATAEPSVAGSTLLPELMRQGLFFPTGHCIGVCLGGYLLQGGFAWNGPKLGLACESVLGLDIVTANGELVHASATENTDLYWAARGSGAGFFGVVVKFYLRLYPRPKYHGAVLQVFAMKHLETVFRWVHEVGPSLSPAVEMNVLISKKTVNNLMPAGIEVTATVFADSKDELHEVTAFMRNSPIKNKAFIRTPILPLSIKTMFKMVMTHYPENHHWGVDNMWTRASIDELLPYLHRIAETMPPPPTHLLWLNWQPPQRQTDMAFSMEDKIYLALYGVWKHAKDSPKYENWAADLMAEMNHLSTGIQLADEGLHRRAAPFVSTAHLHKLDHIRAQRDPGKVFHEWHSRPV
jgi:FAD/FMN-containing dehydrogenase